MKNTITQLIMGLWKPYGIAMSTKLGKLWYSNKEDGQTQGSIWEVGAIFEPLTAMNKVAKTPRVMMKNYAGVYMMAFDYSKDRLYFIANKNSAVYYDFKTNKNVLVTNTLAQAKGITVDVKGQHVYIADYNKGK
jgi:DNA-binding beta-propeller fold protein YncE